LKANHEFAKRLASRRRRTVEVRRPKDNALDISHVLILRARFTAGAYQSYSKNDVSLECANLLALWYVPKR
jgi:hypothetical protein